MTSSPPLAFGGAFEGPLPSNVRLGSGSVVTGDYVSGQFMFKRFRSLREPALVIGRRSIMDGVRFNFGEGAFVEVGDACYFQDVFLLCESQLCIGNRVVIGWHATIVDCDYHPIDPAERLQDVGALSPLGSGVPRPRIVARPVKIEDDVWIGPNATILKGVTIGQAAMIEPGAVVACDVPAGTRVAGNPARVMGESGR